jgi:hypothetical protein
MTYKQLKHLKSSAFKRRCGVRPEIFAQTAEVLQPCLDRRGKRGGQCKLSVEDQLLHVNRRMKIFRILAERYRNRRKRYGLRFNLIAAIINLELAYS